MDIKKREKGHYREINNAKKMYWDGGLVGEDGWVYIAAN